MLLDEIKPAPRKILVFFFLVDANEKIGSCRMEQTRLVLEKILCDINEKIVETDDYEVKIAVLQYGGINWVTSKLEPISVDNYFLKDYSEHNMIGLGSALMELNDKLSRNKFLNSIYMYYPPFIIFIGSGYFSGDLSYEMEILWNNSWYKNALKIAVQTEVKYDTVLFKKLTGNPETVFDINNTELITKILDFRFRDFTS